MLQNCFCFKMTPVSDLHPVCGCLGRPSNLCRVRKCHQTAHRLYLRSQSKLEYCRKSEIVKFHVRFSDFRCLRTEIDKPLHRMRVDPNSHSQGVRAKVRIFRRFPFLLAEIAIVFSEISCFSTQNFHCRGSRWLHSSWEDPSPSGK